VKRLGVIGTMVWDTIYRVGRDEPEEEWGGIAYALAALDAALPAGWELVPLVKVGRDLASRGTAFLRGLERCAPTARFIEVPEANNRVTLRYRSLERRSEQLVAGVPGWHWSELGPFVQELDAIYCNLISGFELDLATAMRLRHAFRGPMYADLHSLLLGLRADGTRAPRIVPRIAEWFGCFDAVQVNEAEMALLGDDPLAVAATAFDAGVRLLVVTLADRGAVYFAQGEPDLSAFPRPTAAGPLRTARLPAQLAADVRDPTGCGDVFGATLMAQLLRQAPIEEGIRSAHRAAARNVEHLGATHLRAHLRGEILHR
jgi:hypothetical protein